MSADAVVVGAGIAGLTVACELAGRGLRVVVLEEARIGAGASGRNTGTLLHQDEPIVDELLALSARRYEELEADGRVVGLRRLPQLFFAGDESQLHVLARRAAALAGRGVAHDRLGPDDLRQEPPHLEALGGLAVGEAWTVAAEQATAAFAEAARAAGAEIRCGERVHRLGPGGVVTGGGLVAAGAVVLATGPWLADLVPGLPVQAGRGWLMRTERLPFDLPWIVEEASWPDQVVLGRAGRPRPLAELAQDAPDAPLAEAFLLCPAEAGEALLGASMALSLRDGTEGADMPSRLARRALRYAPGLGSVGISRAWSGLRPTAPDGLPVVGALPGREGVYVHGGHASLGMQAAPATAAWLADLICAEPAPPQLAALAPERFDPREER
ncbi:MAG TPA: FAD-binding oxidoreductase [Gaiellaceae bacterium]|nr:FAD-binding oxidoreductase [Gaiellaceae bacterium]